MEHNLSFSISKVQLPLIIVKVKEKYICFILDTGSTCSLIDSTVVEYFKDIVEPVGDYYINGIEGSKHKVDMITLPDAFKSIEDESGIQVHALLGTDFLLENKWIIDFEKLKLMY